MANKVKNLDSIRKFVYYAAVILSLGTLWISKLVIQKAIVDALKEN